MRPPRFLHKVVGGSMDWAFPKRSCAKSIFKMPSGFCSYPLEAGGLTVARPSLPVAGPVVEASSTREW